MTLVYALARATSFIEHSIQQSCTGNVIADWRGIDLTGQLLQKRIEGRNASHVDAIDQDDRIGSFAAIGEQHAVGPQLVRSLWRTMLPGVDHRGRAAPRPAQREQGKRGELMYAKSERGHHAKIAAATAPQRPEKVRIVIGIAGQNAPIGNDDLR